MISLEPVNEWEECEGFDDLDEDLMQVISEIFFPNFLEEDFQMLEENMQISVRILRFV